MAALTEHRIALTCGENRYLEAGDGPPLLLLHGMGKAMSANSVELLISGVSVYVRRAGKAGRAGYKGLGSGDLDFPNFELPIAHFSPVPPVLLGYSVKGGDTCR